MNPFLKWLDERTGFVTGFKKIASWQVPASGCLCRWLPVAIIFAFVVQGITGVFLWAFYSPSAQTAWESVWHIQYQIPFGWLVRGIHHYSAQVLVAMLGLYVVALAIHGAYRRPREFVYWTALTMLLFALGSCLTGDLLMWSLSGYFATITRVSFLQLLPWVGLPLYKLVAGGPDPAFGTMTLTRFTVLHIMVCGGGGFALLFLWKWFDLRSRPLSAEKGCCHKCALACAKTEKRPFWGWEAVGAAFVCVLFLAAVLLLVFQRSLTREQIAGRAPTLPAEAYLGAELTSPADPGGSYDAARPEWSFRALYYESKLPIFSKIGMIYAIFVVPPIILGFFYLLPILGRNRFLHALCVLAVAALFVVFCAFTYLSYVDDYKNPEHAPAFLASKAEAEKLAGRAVELCAAPEGIPQTGALSLLNKDPFIQGPKLFAKHCASCHRFEPFGELAASADYAPIECSEPTAPNLYRSVSAEWIGGYMNVEKLLSDDYFGATTNFGEKGSMVTYMKGRVHGGQTDKAGNFMLNDSNGLISAVIAADASPALDILTAAFTEFVEDEDAVAALAEGDVSKLKDLIAEKCGDPEVLAELDPPLPAPVLEALKEVLTAMPDDEAYREIFADEENIETLTDDPETFLTDVYLAQLNGNDEPIPADQTQYVDRIREGIVAACGEAAAVLYDESQLETPRAGSGTDYDGLAEGAVASMEFLGCVDCHPFYGHEKSDHACDLRGYMSKEWLRGFIADPTDAKYYGKHNDRMPAYHPAEGDALMSEDEIAMLADWMHGAWYRAPETANKTVLGRDNEIFPGVKIQSETAPAEAAASAEEFSEEN
ncbi:MAG: cytochrome b N-terminal domain-containing protein [Thermoguttaceae bacterium]|nr:cytochrome b N-terminal domain-containing protein [Thermoguttaceae bacterium]